MTTQEMLTFVQAYNPLYLVAIVALIVAVRASWKILSR
jgi:hypothetical protein